MFQLKSLQMTGNLKISHIHIGINDIDNAVNWFKDKLDISPIYQNDKMAYIQFFDLSIILDKREIDSKVTLALDSLDCDTEYKNLTKRGIESISEPSDNSYGVRSAYLEGPGDITIEIEQVRK